MSTLGDFTNATKVLVGSERVLVQDYDWGPAGSRSTLRDSTRGTKAQADQKACTRHPKDQRTNVVSGGVDLTPPENNATPSLMVNLEI